MQQIRDSEIEQRVLHELHLRKDTDSKEICVFSLNGIVTLAGTVVEDRNSRAAEAAARRAIGVSTVINRIGVAAQIQTPPIPVIRLQTASQPRIGV